TIGTHGEVGIAPSTYSTDLHVAIVGDAHARFKIGKKLQIVNTAARGEDAFSTIVAKSEGRTGSVRTAGDLGDTIDDFIIIGIGISLVNVHARIDAQAFLGTRGINAHPAHGLDEKLTGASGVESGGAVRPNKRVIIHGLGAGAGGKTAIAKYQVVGSAGDLCGGWGVLGIHLFVV